MSFSFDTEIDSLYNEIKTLKTLTMPFNFGTEMDSLCDAFKNLTITSKFSTFTCFPKLPVELQLMIWEASIAEPVVHNTSWLFRHMKRPVIPGICSGIDRLSHNKFAKNHERFILRTNRPALFFNVKHDSILFQNFSDLIFSASLVRREIVTSVQCSARIWDNGQPPVFRPPLTRIDKYLELKWNIRFPYPNLETFIIQDLQCSRKHRLQNNTRRVICKRVIEWYFAEQHAKHHIKIPKILIRVPQQGDKLCCECKRLDRWLAMDLTSRSKAGRMSIIDTETTIPPEYLRTQSNLLPWHISPSDIKC